MPTNSLIERGIIMADADKIEPILALNAFNKPAEASGVTAWTKLITNLLFMEPGAYPTDPEMGCDIGKYEFGFLDDVLDEINENIANQVQTYLPDIPVTTINASKTYSDTGKPILLIAIEFSVENDNEIAVVATEKVEGQLRMAIAC